MRKVWVLYAIHLYRSPRRFTGRRARRENGSGSPSPPRPPYAAMLWISRPVPAGANAAPRRAVLRKGWSRRYLRRANAPSPLDRRSREPVDNLLTVSRGTVAAEELSHER